MAQTFRSLNHTQRFSFGVICAFAFFASVLFGLVFFSSSVSALDSHGHFDNWNGTRTYRYGTTGDIVRSASFSGTTGSIILGTNYYLFGFNIGQNITIGDSTTVPPMYFTMVLNLNQSGGSSGSVSNNPWWRLNSSSDPADIPVTCAIWDNFNIVHTYSASLEYQGGIDTGWQVSWRCTASTGDFAQVSQARFYVGNENGNTLIGSGTPNDIILVGASYRFVAGNDSSSEIQTQQLYVQEQIRDGVGQTTDAVNNQGRAVVGAINDLRTATEEAEDGEQSRWEADHEERDEKEEELNDQAGDLSLSAQNPGNPFANLFNASGCVDMPTVGGWFGNSNLRVCSPYPSTIRFIFDFVGSAIILGFLLRIYIKHLNGGFNT